MTPEQAAELRKPFPKSAIGKLPKGGTQLDYVGHAAVTDRLLAIDPEWSWEPFALDEHGLPALDRAGNLWIRLTVAGTTRVGVGDGKNAKEIIGDALRNAAMRFGVALDLWSKEELEQGHLPESAPITPPPAREAQRPTAGITDAQMRALHASLKEQGITERDVALTTISTLLGTPIESTKDLTKAQASTVIDALKQQDSPAEEPASIPGWEQ